jgi:hypothetical protein
MRNGPRMTSSTPSGPTSGRIKRIAVRHLKLPVAAGDNKKLGGGEYQRYANCDAIEVGYTDAIPSDYDGVMGVPITFLDKYNPDQFEILGTSLQLGRPMSEVARKGTYPSGGPRFYVPDGDGTYRRT